MSTTTAITKTIEMEAKDVRYLHNKLLMKKRSMEEELARTEQLITPLAKALEGIPISPENEAEEKFQEWYRNFRFSEAGSCADFVKKAFDAGYAAASSPTP